MHREHRRQAGYCDQLPWTTLRRLANRITNLPNVNRCLYDLTPKPPATVEYV